MAARKALVLLADIASDMLGGASRAGTGGPCSKPGSCLAQSYIEWMRHRQKRGAPALCALCAPYLEMRSEPPSRHSTVSVRLRSYCLLLVPHLDIYHLHPHGQPAIMVATTVTLSSACAGSDLLTRIAFSHFMGLAACTAASDVQDEMDW